MYIITINHIIHQKCIRNAAGTATGQLPNSTALKLKLPVLIEPLVQPPPDI